MGEYYMVDLYVHTTVVLLLYSGVVLFIFSLMVRRAASVSILFLILYIFAVTMRMNTPYYLLIPQLLPPLSF